MKIALIVAMDKEFAQLRSLLENEKVETHRNITFVTGTIGTHQLVVLQCGIGKVNSTIGTVEMINRYAPQLVVSTGVAGGADVQMNPLEVVVGTQYAYHDLYCGTEVAYGQLPGLPARFDATAQMVKCALALDAETPIHGGLIVSGDWFVDSKEKMRSILEHFPEAKAVDMESCSIAHTCHRYQTPFVSFRIISDVPLKDEKAAQYYDFWERMANGSFAVVSKFLNNI